MIQTTTSAGIAQNPLLPAVLRLSLKKKWYDMILSGEKKEEYREIKSYWLTRLINTDNYPMESIGDKANVVNDIIFDIEENNCTDINEVVTAYFCKKKSFSLIEFKNGYSKDAPTMLVEFKGVEIGEAKPEWSDSWQGKVFSISLGAVLHSR